MNIINRMNAGQEGVAGWFFDYISNPPSWRTEVSALDQEQCFRSFMKTTEQALKILKDNDLFKLKRILISDFRDYAMKTPDNWVMDQGMPLDFNYETTFTDLICESTKKKFQRFIFPDCVYFYGSTALDTEEGRKMYDAVFFIISDPGDYIRITTDCDI